MPQTSDKEIPDFDSGKSYLLRGTTGQTIKSLIRRNRPRTVTRGGITIVQQTEDGTWLALDADELTLNVCINGVSTSKTFYVKRVGG